jgi:nitrogen-specific signal transduction histidine kinase/ActR/RegA family two-component response regulator
VPQFGNDLVLRWFGTFTDIEERKRAEQALLQQQKLESTGVLAGGLAHDFNNLLVGIIGGISYTLETLPSSHEVRPMLENALTASEHAATLVRQMLAYAGKGKFVIAQVELPELVRATCELLRSFIPKSVQLDLELGSVVPVIEGDASQIQQIIMNLVINAAEAIGEGNPGVVTVRIGEERLDRANPEEQLEPGIYAALEVTDTGCGMSEEVQARIFDPFFTTKFTGRGLGLAAVIGIVRSAKGTIRVHSAPGRGATFRVLLPARAASGIAPEAPRQRAAEGAGRDILLIDDEEIVRNTVRRILERSGHTVQLAAGGYEAISLVHADPALFDLVLLDMNMPELSGEETLSRLRALRPALNVAVFSGYSEAEILQRLGGQKVTGILYKPFNARTLISKVREFLESGAACLNAQPISRQ